MKTTEWRIYHDYVLEENRITPKPGVGYRIYDPLDQFYDDQESQPIYIELANIAITRLQQEKYGKPTTRLAEDLLDFTKKYGPLGIGWRYTLLLRAENLSSCTVIVDPESEGLLNSVLDCRLLKSTPSLTADVAFQLGYKLFDYKDDTVLAVKINHEPVFVEGSKFFGAFYPKDKLRCISPQSSKMWDEYSETVGSLTYPLESLPILDSFDSESRKKGLYPSVDTLGTNLSLYAEYFLLTLENRQHTGKHTPFINLIQPKLRPMLTRNGVKYYCQSLLDICFWMIHLEQRSSNRIRQCPWCGRFNRFSEKAPPNAEYCPPQKGRKSCAARYADLKYKQRNQWNEHLRSLYPDFNKNTLSDAWGIDVENIGYWDESVKDPVLHPMDLRAKGILPGSIRVDFLKWKPNFKRNPKNYLVTDFDWIVSNDEN